MPLLLRTATTEGVQVALWRIAEGELAPSLLPEGLFDRERYGRLSHPGVRAGYLAARMALASLPIPELHLLQREDGRPHCRPRGIVSLSHTPGYGAAAYHPSIACGIDLELRAREVTPALQRRFLSPEEERDIGEAKGNPIIHWGAKEAIYKGDGGSSLDFRESIRIQAVRWTPSFVGKGRTPRTHPVHPDGASSAAPDRYWRVEDLGDDRVAMLVATELWNSAELPNP